MSFGIRIQLKTAETEIACEGCIRDLSLSGVMIKTTEQLPIETPCDLIIELTGSVEPIRLEISGLVVRHDTDGVAVAFKSMGLDSYTHLKNVVRYNSDTPDEIF